MPRPEPIEALLSFTSTWLSRVFCALVCPATPQTVATWTITFLDPLYLHAVCVAHAVPPDGNARPPFSIWQSLVSRMSASVIPSSAKKQFLVLLELLVLSPLCSPHCVTLKPHFPQVALHLWCAKLSFPLDSVQAKVVHLSPHLPHLYSEFVPVLGQGHAGCPLE